MQMRPLFALLLTGILFLCAATSAAQAALFCAESAGGMPECVFEDAHACRTRAEEVGGRCTVNQADLQDVALGASPVCLVYSPTTIQCLYQDFSSCNRAARHNNAACVNVSSVQIFDETRSGAIDTQNRNAPTRPKPR